MSTPTDEPRPSRSASPAARSSFVARGLAVAAVAAGVGVMVGYLAKPNTSNDPFINFDPESTPPAVLASGWSGFEAMPLGDTFAWCVSKICGIQVNIGREENRIVRVRLWPFLFPGAPRQTVEVLVNGISIGSKPLADVASVLSFSAATAVWRKGPNELRFRFAYAVEPRSKYPESEDPRELAAAFDWVEIARPPHVPPR